MINSDEFNSINSHVCMKLENEDLIIDFKNISKTLIYYLSFS
jgi:hypothetical protein